MNGFAPLLVAIAVAQGAPQPAAPPEAPSAAPPSEAPPAPSRPPPAAVELPELKAPAAAEDPTPSPAVSPAPTPTPPARTPKDPGTSTPSPTRVPTTSTPTSTPTSTTPTSGAGAAVHPERSADAEASARSRRATPPPSPVPVPAALQPPPVPAQLPPSSERGDAERAARTFLEALAARDTDALVRGASDRFSFDGEPQSGRDAIRRTWRGILDGREEPTPRVGRIEILQAADAVARLGRPPARIAPLVRPGVLVAVGEVGGRTVVLFLSREAGRMAVLGMHD